MESCTTHLALYCQSLRANPDVIELPESMLSSLTGTHSRANGFTIPDYVSVSALSRVRHATRVLVEPLTTEDWELLEIHGEDMEHGGLLSKVSLVYPKQTLTLPVGRGERDRVHIVIKEAAGGIDHGDSNVSSSLWPALPNSNLSAIEDDETGAPCVLLVHDTEVIVIPKPRQTKKTSPWSAPLRLIPTQLDWSQGIMDMLSRMNSVSGEYLPVGAEAGCIIVNIDAWAFQGHWARIKRESKSTGNKEIVVKVVKSARIPIQDAGMLTSSCSGFRIRFYDEKEKP